jgi:hypothetical protein
VATNVIVAGGTSFGKQLPYVSGASAADFSTLIFDAVTNVNVNLTNNLTLHPVESKQDIADHIYSNNDKFEVIGVVTNTPIQPYQGNIVEYNLDVKRTQKAVDYLRTLKESKVIFTLITEFEIFDDCVVTSLDYNVNAQEADQLVFRIGIERVRFVTAQSVTLEGTSQPVSQTANGSSTQSSNANIDGTENKSDGASQKQSHVERTRAQQAERIGGF